MAVVTTRARARFSRVVEIFNYLRTRDLINRACRRHYENTDLNTNQWQRTFYYVIQHPVFIFEAKFGSQIWTVLILWFLIILYFRPGIQAFHYLCGVNAVRLNGRLDVCIRQVRLGHVPFSLSLMQLTRWRSRCRKGRDEALHSGKNSRGS